MKCQVLSVGSLTELVVIGSVLRECCFPREFFSMLYPVFNILLPLQSRRWTWCPKLHH